MQGAYLLQYCIQLLLTALSGNLAPAGRRQHSRYRRNAVSAQSLTAATCQTVTAGHTTAVLATNSQLLLIHLRRALPQTSCCCWRDRRQSLLCCCLHDISPAAPDPLLQLLLCWSAHLVDNQHVDALLAAQATLGGILDARSSSTTLRAAQGQTGQQNQVSRVICRACAVLLRLSGGMSTKCCPYWQGLSSCGWLLQ